MKGLEQVQPAIMKGRICLVTGANSGIGAAAATELSGLGAKVVMVCRDAKRGELTRAQILKQHPQAHLDLMILDLASQTSIRAFATEFATRYNQLDVLINNAATINSRRSLTLDGLETTFATNVLGPFLLTNLLLPILQVTPAARIVNVAARTFPGVKLDLTNLQCERNYNGARAYLYSKLANVMLTYELARRLAGSGVTANALHPGIIRTSLSRDFHPLINGAIKGLGLVFAKSPAQGAETIVYLASSSEVAGISGQYFINKKAVKSSAESYDVEVATRLWDICSQLVGLTGAPTPPKPPTSDKSV